MNMLSKALALVEENSCSNTFHELAAAFAHAAKTSENPIVPCLALHSFFFEIPNSPVSDRPIAPS